MRQTYTIVLCAMGRRKEHVFRVRPFLREYANGERPTLKVGVFAGPTPASRTTSLQV